MAGKSWTITPAAWAGSEHRKSVIWACSKRRRRTFRRLRRRARWVAERAPRRAAKEQTNPVLKTILRRLRLVGYTEGVSFLVLLGIAMPLKYFAGMPLAVTIVGAIHGLLWILYVA